MKGKVVLPFIKPMISHAPMDTHVLSILGTQMPQRNDWILSNYINIRMELDTLSDTFCPHNLLFCCPFLKCSEVNYLECVDRFQTFSEFCKNAIDNGNYIYPIINERYIKQYQTDEDIDHNPIIYGYNNDLKYVYMADFFRGIYTLTTVPFEELNAAALNLKVIPDYGKDGYFLSDAQHCWQFSLFPPDEVDYSFNQLELFEETKHFLSRTNSQPADRECLFGLDCFDYAINERMTMRILSLFYCISYLWLKRIQYLYDRKLIMLDILRSVEPIITACCNQSQMNKLLYIKCKQKQDHSDQALIKIKNGMQSNCDLLTKALKVILDNNQIV